MGLIFHLIAVIHDNINLGRQPNSDYLAFVASDAFVCTLLATCLSKSIKRSYWQSFLLAIFLGLAGVILVWALPDQRFRKPSTRELLEQQNDLLRTIARQKANEDSPVKQSDNLHSRN